MKNKLTLSLAIFTAFVAGSIFLFMILDLTTFDKLFNIEARGNNGYRGYSQYELNRNVSIVTLIFSALSFAISISGIIFYKRMDEADFRVWYFAAVIISLSFTFGLAVCLLTSTFGFFKEISEYKKIGVPQMTNTNGGYGGSLSSTLSQSLSSYDQDELDSKPWLLLAGYMFAIKAALSAVACLGLIFAVVLALREVGQSQFSAPAQKLPYKEVTKPISSRKLQSSIDTLTKAKALLDSGVISNTDFNKIKERELNL